MEEKKLYNEEDIKKFHLPRWEDIPNIDLYIDQVVSLLETYLSTYIKGENNKEDKIVTKTMINNYVKHKIINPPVNKKYNTEHIAYLFVICILKQVYSINDIAELIKLAIDTVSPETAYNQFCDELEKAISLTFAGQEYTGREIMTKEKYILRNVVQSFANQLYVKRVYLKK